MRFHAKEITGVAAPVILIRLAVNYKYLSSHL